MSTRILVFGIFLHLISFSNVDGIFSNGLFTDEVSTDGGFTDGLSWFNDENVDPLQDIYSLDPTLVSEDLDGFDTFLDDSGSDLFGGSSIDSINDPTLLAECTSTNTNNDYPSKTKARVRRQAACRNRASEFNPKLSLPTLDQVFPADNENPKSESESPNSGDSEQPRRKPPNRVMNEIIVPGAGTLKFLDLSVQYLTDCGPGENPVCSSGQSSDIVLESSETTWNVKVGIFCTFVFFFF